LPLWLLCGWVDDENQHSESAYNDALAAAGYNITIIASDGYSVTIDSRDTIRNSNYIIANTLNGTHIHESSSSWPLRLVGTDISGSTTVKGSRRLNWIFPLRHQRQHQDHTAVEEEHLKILMAMAT
jgi:hypothetical protein